MRDLLLDPERLRALHATWLMSSASEAVYDRYTRLAARLLRAPIAAINLVDGEHQFCKSAYLPQGLRKMEIIPLEDSICVYVVRSGASVVISNALEDERVSQNRMVTEHGVRSYLGVPLRTSDGRILGSLCVLDSVAREWDEGQEEALCELADAVAEEIQMRVDLTLRERVEASMRKANDMLSALIEASAVPIIALTPEGDVMLWNPAAETVFGWSAEEVLGKQVPFFGSEQRAEIEALRARVLQGESMSGVEVRRRRKDGQERWLRLNAAPIHDDGGRIVGQVSVMEDVSEMKRMQRELEALALQDTLTGLHNRRSFVALAEQELRLADRMGKEALVFFGDMDNLKCINDHQGHGAGDEAIQEAAAILRSAFRDCDIVARHSGDEFVIFTLGCGEVEADLIRTRVSELFEESNVRSQRPYPLGMSLGFAAWKPGDPVDVPNLLERADRAMYQVKRARKISR